MEFPRVGNFRTTPRLHSLSKWHPEASTSLVMRASLAVIAVLVAVSFSPEVADAAAAFRGGDNINSVEGSKSALEEYAGLGHACDFVVIERMIS